MCKLTHLKAKTSKQLLLLCFFTSQIRASIWWANFWTLFSRSIPNSWRIEAQHHFIFPFWGNFLGGCCFSLGFTANATKPTDGRPIGFCSFSSQNTRKFTKYICVPAAIGPNLWLVNFARTFRTISQKTANHNVTTELSLLTGIFPVKSKQFLSLPNNSA